MITTDELKVQLAEYHTAVKDLEEALAIDASRKRVQELEHTMSRPGFYDDAELSKKVFDEVGDPCAWLMMKRLLLFFETRGIKR